ncbi:hypothetical protein PCE1_002186 [Barthelona sp. PCE]
MFVISTVSDSIFVHPKDFKQNLEQLTIDAITLNYVGKVLTDLGLVIALDAINSYEKPKVYPGEGGIHIQCEFRLLCHRPYVGEIIEGMVTKIDQHGIWFGTTILPSFFIDFSQLQMFKPESFDTPTTFLRFNEIENIYFPSFCIIPTITVVRARCMSIEYREDSQRPMVVHCAIDEANYGFSFNDQFYETPINAMQIPEHREAFIQAHVDAAKGLHEKVHCEDDPRRKQQYLQLAAKVDQIVGLVKAGSTTLGEDEIFSDEEEESDEDTRLQ